MNRYFMIRRLTGPLVLLLLGVVALLHQMHWVRWGIFVPLLLILLGVMKLAERAALETGGFWHQPQAEAAQAQTIDAGPGSAPTEGEGGQL
jgi:hypothetical protein